MNVPEITGKTEFIATYSDTLLRPTLDAYHDKKSAVIPFPNNQEWSSGNLLEVLNRHWVAKRRCFLEENIMHRHPIAYGVIASNIEGVWKVFVYQRTKQTGEGRLTGKYSIGVGGHIEASDVFGAGLENNLIQAISLAFVREADEEFTFYTTEDVPIVNTRRIAVMDASDTDPVPELIINSDEGVDLFHLGIVPILKLTTPISQVESNEVDNIAIGFMTLEELKSEEIFDKLESWSQKILEHVFKSLG